MIVPRSRRLFKVNVFVHMKVCSPFDVKIYKVHLTSIYGSVSKVEPFQTFRFVLHFKSLKVVFSNNFVKQVADYIQESHLRWKKTPWINLTYHLKAPYCWIKAFFKCSWTNQSIKWLWEYGSWKAGSSSFKKLIHFNTLFLNVFLDFLLRLHCPSTNPGQCYGGVWGYIHSHTYNTGNSETPDSLTETLEPTQHR